MTVRFGGDGTGLVLRETPKGWRVGLGPTKDASHFAAYEAKLQELNRTLESLLADIQRGAVNEESIEPILRGKALPPGMDQQSREGSSTKDE